MTREPSCATSTEYEHDWKLVDDSAGDEHNMRIDRYYECRICGAVRAIEDGDDDAPDENTYDTGNAV